MSESTAVSTEHARNDEQTVPTAALAGALQIAGFAGPQMWSSISPKNDADIALFSRAMSAEPKLLTDLVNTEITVEHVVIHRAEIRVNDGRDLLETARLVLIGVNGELYSTTGMVAVKSFMALMGLVGPPPYAEPLRLRIDPVKLKNGGKAVAMVFLRRDPRPKSARK